jgi:hypothetical protein
LGILEKALVMHELDEGTKVKRAAFKRAADSAFAHFAAVTKKLELDIVKNRDK